MLKNMPASFNANRLSVFVKQFRASKVYGTQLSRPALRTIMDHLDDMGEDPFTWTPTTICCTYEEVTVAQAKHATVIGKGKNRHVVGLV